MPVDPKEKANDAVDGNPETCSKTNDIGATSPRSTVWWKVDLGRMYDIYSISILFKNYTNFGMNFKYSYLSYIYPKKRLHFKTNYKKSYYN